ncbi:SH2 domain-containing protein 1A-like isoform X1 [Clarias gariepinus]|uniref:SH2 domain-containing protein 1A-like isoform X1 n=1 Tax=Clarias gariepinus TaxID=13013 RepID=UPI00234C7EF4|nr:SH2 domain-containing protein 1A-like isoform X1 [Clarias gariepinus]
MLQSVYYGQIGQRDVERLLGKYGKDGSFLLRDSQSEHGALCLCVRKAPYVHTYRIIQSPQGWAVETQNKAKIQWFPSLDILVESYKVTPHNMVPLLYPLEKSHLSEEERQNRGACSLSQKTHTIWEHQFGLWEETGVPGGNPSSTGRTCKLHAHREGRRTWLGIEPRPWRCKGDSANH